MASRMPRKGTAFFAATALAAVFLVVLVSRTTGGDDGETPVELDTLNPFGSVQDVQLPDALGQPPTLSHLFHSSYGPGFNDAGQAVSASSSHSAARRGWAQPPQKPSLSYVGPLSVGPLSAHISPGDPDPSGYMRERASYGDAQPFFAHPSAAAPAAPAAPKSYPSDWEVEADARSEYWRALDDYYAANQYADYVRWMTYRSQQQGLAAEPGSQQAVLEAEEGATGDKKNAAARLEASKRLVNLLGEGSRWSGLQNAWGFFYTANKELDSKQKYVNQRRGELLAQVSSPSNPTKGVYVSSYVAPWLPFDHCQEANAAHAQSYACKMAVGLDTPRGEVGFTPANVMASKAAGTTTNQLSSSTHGRQQEQQRQQQQPKASDGPQSSSSLQEELAPLNDEQARINRARMLLYVREFGPLRALLDPRDAGNADSSSASGGKAGLKVAKGTSKLPYYPGDFELPKVTDCDEPGKCHDWTNGQYIDNFAGATTNWDLMGSHQAGYMHWDTMPGDAWRGGPGAYDDGGAVRWKQARTSQLTEVSGDYSGFDWAAFNKKQAVIAARAQQAAHVLLSPSVQQQPFEKLLVQADPSLGAQISAAEAGKRRSAVGGMGTWAETHDPSADPSKEGSGFVIPPGMPFGGGGATRALGSGSSGKESTEGEWKMPDLTGGGASRPLDGGVAARRKALQGQLKRVETLMNKQWGVGKGIERGIQRSTERESQKDEAERAAKTSSEQIKRLLGARRGRGRTVGADLRSIAAPLVKRRETEAERGAQRAVHALLAARERSVSDDPQSNKERVEMKKRVRAAVRELKNLAAGRHEGAEGGAKASEAGSSVVGGKQRGIRAKLEREEEENRRLRAKVSELSRRGSEEKLIAAEVAKKLAPRVVRDAASSVARAVSARASELKTRRGMTRRVQTLVGTESAHNEKLPVREHTSSNYKSTDRPWKGHYFNRQFWSTLSHYFAGDRAGDSCTECVGDFMTAAHDIRLSSGASESANPKVVPYLCQAACRRGEPLSIKFPREGHNYDTYGGGPDPQEAQASEERDDADALPEPTDYKDDAKEEPSTWERAVSFSK